MPADLIDWPSIRANAVAIGVREAARQAAADLPPIEQNRFVERVMKRSTREGWIVRKTEVQAAVRLTPTLAIAKPLSAPVRTAADSMANHLADLGKQTKLGLATATKKAADTFAKRSGSDVIESAQALRHVTAAAATLHGWNEDKAGGLTLNLGIMLGNMQ